MGKIVYGAKLVDGNVVLAYGGKNFEQGSFAQTDFWEIETGRLRSEKSKAKKAREILERIAEEE